MAAVSDRQTDRLVTWRICPGSRQVNSGRCHPGGWLYRARPTSSDLSGVCTSNVLGPGCQSI